MRVLGARQAEQFGEVGLARRGGQEVLAADYLVDALRGIIDDDGEVVRPHPVTPTQHHVIHNTRIEAVDPVENRELGDLGPKPQCGDTPPPEVAAAKLIANGWALTGTKASDGVEQRAFTKGGDTSRYIAIATVDGTTIQGLLAQWTWQ